MLDKYAKKSEHVMYVIFRIIIGALYAMHGLSKLGFTGKPAMTGLMAFVGVAELLIGLGLVLGLFTRLAALGGIVIMIGAQTTSHFPKGLNPMANGGELSLLFLVAFLVLFAYGAQKFSLGHKLFKKEFW
jgi:putative oxidoreductase